MTSEKKMSEKKWQLTKYGEWQKVTGDKKWQVTKSDKWQKVSEKSEKL